MNFKQLKSKTRNFFRVVIGDPRRKNMLQISGEYLRFLLTDRVVADQYFEKYLYRKGKHNFHDYLLTEKMLYQCWKQNDPDYVSILDNKHLFELYFSRYKLPLVKSLAYNINSLFFMQDEVIQIHSFEAFIHFLSALIKEKSSAGGIFIKKKEGSCGGKGIYKITSGELESDTAKLQNLFREIIGSGFMFQDLVVQHEELNKLNPFCLNTIRIDTYTNRDHVSKVLSSFIRLGINQSYLDNVSSGGVFVGINLADGTLRSEAFSDFTHGKGKFFNIHPETKTRFEGFRIPFFQEAMKLATDAAYRIPQLKVIGWDIAIRPDGPILVEGNDTPGLSFSEIGQNGFKNNPVFYEMLEEMNNK